MIFRRRVNSVDSSAWIASWSEAAVNRVVPNLLDVRDGIGTLAVAGDATTSRVLLRHIGRMIGRPFDWRLPLSLLGFDGEQVGAVDAQQAVFDRLFERRSSPDPGKPALIFLGVTPESVTASRISALLAWLAGVAGLVVLPEPTIPRIRAEILDLLSGTRLLPLFVSAPRPGSPQGPGVLDTEHLARTIHDMFLENAWTRGERLGSTPALRPWQMLEETYRAPNRSQADHILFKLAAAGLIMSPTPTFADGSTEPVWSRLDILESLACMEHDRWASERILAGWTHGGVRDDRARHHPDLRPYSSLSEEAREKDRVAVATIPFILHTGGFGWSPLITVTLAPDCPDPTARCGWRARWRRDAARVAEERAPAVLELLVDPGQPHHIMVGLVASRLGFPISLQLTDADALSAMFSDKVARQSLVQCLTICRHCVWDGSPDRSSDTSASLTAVATSRHGFRVERSESSP